MLPKSPLADGLRYVLNQWQALCRFTEAGLLALDNNETDRINKLIARGRVNWLFVGSPRGGETAARLLSLVVTCRRLHMDSFLYLRPDEGLASLKELVRSEDSITSMAKRLGLRSRNYHQFQARPRVARMQTVAPVSVTNQA